MSINWKIKRMHKILGILKRKEKVYCKDCKYYGESSNLYHGDKELIVVNGKFLHEQNRYIHGYCLSRATSGRVNKGNHYRPDYRTVIKAEDPRDLNKNNECQRFRPQWWKFWLK